MADKDSKRPAVGVSHAYDPKDPNQPSLRTVRTTSVFRILNFELFLKPNRVVMGLGLAAITGCVIFLGYMNAQAENRRHESQYTLQEDGRMLKSQRKSKWD